MFSKISRGIFSGVNKFFSKERLAILIVFIVLLVALTMYTTNKFTVKDGMEDGDYSDDDSDYSDDSDDSDDDDDYKPSNDLFNNETFKGKETSGYSTKDVANPKDLLPADENSQWAALNPSTANKGDMMPDLLKAGQHIGLDTVGQSLRNANLQLRSDPVISKGDTGPWNQTTMEADYGRVPLELGA